MANEFSTYHNYHYAPLVCLRSDSSLVCKCGMIATVDDRPSGFKQNDKFPAPVAYVLIGLQQQFLKEQHAIQQMFFPVQEGSSNAWV